MVPSDGETSSQVDVLVIDESLVSAYLYREGNFAVVSPAAVAAAIEVKTCLDATRFDEAVNNIASVKRLLATPERVSGLVFGYDGTEPRIEVLDGWFKREAAASLRDSPELGPSLISFFAHGTILAKMNPAQGYDDTSPEYRLVRNVASVAGGIDERVGEGWQLRQMLALIQGACLARDVVGRGNAAAAVEDIRALLTFSGAVSSVHQYFSLGTGYADHRAAGDQAADA